MCFVALTFLRCAHDTAPQTDSCCSLLTAACKYARDKKIQEKQQKLNSLPPILRPKNKKSRELAAVTHFQQKIRPRRFVDTDKLNRKQWARTEVALNPFLYDKKTSWLWFIRAPQKHLKATTTPMKASMALSLFPSPCRPHLAITLTSRMGDLSRPVRGNCGAMRELRGDAVATSPGLKPKKVGAKKGSLIPRLIRRRKELHLNLSNTDILHRSYCWLSVSRHSK